MSLKEQGFLTHEIGSLRKPNYFVKLARQETVKETEFQELKDLFTLSKKEDVFIQHEREFRRLMKNGVNTQEDKDFIKKMRVYLNVWFKESTGLDVIDAGEWLRREMYQYVIEHESFHGIKLLRHIRSFDHNYYRPGVYEGRIMFDSQKPIHLEELELAKEVATKPVKLCMTSFNTIAEWTYEGWGNFDDLIFELIDEYYVPEVKRILQSGVNWLQLDEPALTTNPDRMEVFVDAWNYFIDKIQSWLSSETMIGMHNCFSNYNLLFPILPELKRLETLSLEYANRDSWELGVTRNVRRAYFEAEKAIKEAYENGFNGKLSLGVIPVHTQRTPSPELIRDRILALHEIIGSEQFTLVGPDCGLRTRTLPHAHELLVNMVRGAELAKKHVGIF